MKITFLVFAALGVLVCPNVAPAQTANPVSGIRSVDFRDRTYSFDVGGDEETVELRGGEYKEGDGGLQFDVGKSDVVYGDLNGDGAEDAVVRIRLTSGASLRGFEIQAYEFKDGEARLLARLGMARVTKDLRGRSVCCTGEGLRIDRGRVILEALTDGKIFLDAEKVTTFEYALRRGRFVLVGAPKSRRLPR